MKEEEFWQSKPNFPFGLNFVKNVLRADLKLSSKQDFYCKFIPVSTDLNLAGPAAE